MTFRDEIQQSSEVGFAMAVFHALNSNNFVRFFRLLRYVNPLFTVLFTWIYRRNIFLSMICSKGNGPRFSKPFLTHTKVLIRMRVLSFIFRLLRYVNPLFTVLFTWIYRRNIFLSMICSKGNGPRFSKPFLTHTKVLIRMRVLSFIDDYVIS